MKVAVNKGILLAALIAVPLPSKAMSPWGKGVVVAGGAVAALAVTALAYYRLKDRCPVYVEQELAHALDLIRQADGAAGAAALHEMGDVMYSLQRRCHADYGVAMLSHIYVSNLYRLTEPYNDPKRMYENLSQVLGASVSKMVSQREIHALIKARAEQQDISEEHRWILRQFGYTFGTPYYKEEYDAYLVGPEAVARLRLAPKLQERLSDCFMAIREAEGRLR